MNETNSAPQPQTITDKLAELPGLPGIYRFYSDKGSMIYVGKAKSLKHRVKSYFLESNRLDWRIRYLVPQIADLDWMVTHTEAEALILEDQLIKTHRPRYNVQLKDDKSYPYFKLSIQELYPRLTLVRELKKDGSLYFGPYVSAGKARETSRIIKKHFQLRQRPLKLDGTKKHRPCLNYQMKRCFAPCAGLISPEAYGEIVEKVLHLLRGNYDQLLAVLRSEMENKAEKLEFEEAARIRDQIDSVKSTLQKQQVVSKHKTDRDVFALVRSGGFAGVQVLFVRNGILLSDDFVFFEQAEIYEDLEIIRSMLSSFYVSGGKEIPREILLPFHYEDATMLEAYCSSRRNSVVKVLSPQRGEKKALIQMAEKNGEENLKLTMKARESDRLVLEEVQQKLKLHKLPNRVECFDISNISGTHSVGSMVVWEANKPQKSAYRKYRIKTVTGANDYAAMEEVLTRRYRNAAEDPDSLPDLIIIDGGKGQLAIAMRILGELGLDLEKVDVIGLAKGRSERKRGTDTVDMDYEYVVKPQRKNEIHLKRNSSTLFFLQNIRDEAHRFAISYFRKLHGKRSISSELDLIPGIGPKKKKRLLTAFSSIKKIKEASEDELLAVEGISQQDAAAVRQHFHEA